MQLLEVSGEVRLIYRSLGVKGLIEPRFGRCSAPVHSTDPTDTDTPISVITKYFDLLLMAL